MKKIAVFFAETFYELFLNKTIVFIFLPIISLSAWQIGADDIVSMFGLITFFCSVIWILFCLLQGWILFRLDRQRWQSLRDSANGGRPFLQTRNAWYVGIVSVMMPVLSICMLLSHTASPSLLLLVILDVLSVVYLVLFIRGLLHNR